MFKHDRKQGTIRVAVGRSCFFGLLFPFLGFFFGAFLGDWLDRSADGYDESGSMGMWLPSGWMSVLACVGTVAMYVFYRSLRIGFVFSVDGLRRGVADLATAASLASVGVISGAFVGQLSAQRGTGAVLGGLLGLAIMLVRKCVQTRMV